MIKENESKVGNDRLLVSGYFYTSNIMSIELKPDTCEPLQFTYHVYYIHVASSMYLRHVPGFHIGIYIIFL